MLLEVLVNLTDWADAPYGTWLTQNRHTEPASFRRGGGRFSTPCEGRCKADSKSC